MSGRLVVAGILVLAVGGTYLLNVATKGPPTALQSLFATTSATPRRTPSGTVVVRPTSRPATPGVASPLSLTTPCGMAGTIDFDDSFWRPRDGRPLSRLGPDLARPIDPSTITLQTADSALARTAAGQAILLVRSGLERVRIPACG